MLQPLDGGNDLVDRELGVDEDDVGRLVADHLDGRVDIGRLGHDLDLRVGLDDLAEDGANKGVLTDQDEPDVLDSGRWRPPALIGHSCSPDGSAWLNYRTVPTGPRTGDQRVIFSNQQYWDGETPACPTLID